MMNQKMTDRHRQFLEGCLSMQLYYKYVIKKTQSAIEFDRQELEKYHKAYVKLVDCLGDYSGCQLRINIKSLMESTKTPDDKYKDYKEAIQEQTEIYNKVYALHKRKQIKLKEEL